MASPIVIAPVKLPSPAYREYLAFVATVIATLAILQFTGIFFGDPGAVDLRYLLGIALVLPVSTYLLTVVQENVEWIPRWDRMVQTSE
jgi:hypothetical protein